MMSPPRPLQPYRLRMHRRDQLHRYVDLRPSLPDGIVITAATVRWAIRRPGGGLVDRTAMMGAPTVDIDPPAVPGPGGQDRGGPGTVRFSQSPSADLARGEYEISLLVTLSSGEEVSWHGIDDFSDWADAID